MSCCADICLQSSEAQNYVPSMDSRSTLGWQSHPAIVFDKFSPLCIHNNSIGNQTMKANRWGWAVIANGH